MGSALLLLSASLIVGSSGATDLISRYENGERAFREIEIGDMLVYYHLRTVDGAKVEKDYIVYQFDRGTGDLLARKSHWRDDLPEHLPAGLISREGAEGIVGGEILFSDLYIISPESDVFALDPVPQDPCWVVRSLVGGTVRVTVVDATDGSILGNGVPPPYTGFSLTGPWEFQPCSGAWTAWMNNARDWFETMGYPTEAVEWPGQKKVKGHVQSGQTAMFYELAHGGSDLFQSGCLLGDIPSNTTANEIETWIADYAKMPFTFIGSCGGMCDTLDNTFSYEFRKGSAESTVTVGYCGMGESYCGDCWSVSIQWQAALFNYMNQGWTVRAAFDQANADYPVCANYDCMRFAGDPDFTVVPLITRDPWPPQVTVVQPNGGEVVEHDDTYEVRWLVADNSRIDSVAILLSMDGGTTYPDTIAAREYNDSSYTWTVPDLDSKTARVRVVAVDASDNVGMDASDGDFTLWGTISAVEVSDLPERPDEVMLEVMGANPGISGVTVLFGLPRPMYVRLDIYDVAGRHIVNLAEGHRQDGFYSASWACSRGSESGRGPGVYFIRLRYPEGSRTAKVVVAG